MCRRDWTWRVAGRLQIAGGQFGEEDVLAVAAQIQKLRPIGSPLANEDDDRSTGDLFEHLERYHLTSRAGAPPKLEVEKPGVRRSQYHD